VFAKFCAHRVQIVAERMTDIVVMRVAARSGSSAKLLAWVTLSNLGRAAGLYSPVRQSRASVILRPLASFSLVFW